MTLRPVGVIKDQTKEAFLKAEGDNLKLDGDLEEIAHKVRESQADLSEIVIDSDLTGLLDGMDEYSHLVVLYWAHEVPPAGRSLTRIHPMGRTEIPQVGIFSSCSPARPNPVLMTVVRLHERKGNILTVAGLDAIDGSPVVDIKPYVKEFYPQEGVVIAGWMRRILEEMEEPA